MVQTTGNFELFTTKKKIDAIFRNISVGEKNCLIKIINLKTTIFKCSKIYSISTRVTRFKVATNIADPISFKKTVSIYSRMWQICRSIQWFSRTRLWHQASLYVLALVTMVEDLLLIQKLLRSPKSSWNGSVNITAIDWRSKISFTSWCDGVINHRA